VAKTLPGKEGERKHNRNKDGTILSKEYSKERPLQIPGKIVAGEDKSKRGKGGASSKAGVAEGAYSRDRRNLKCSPPRCERGKEKSGKKG